MSEQNKRIKYQKRLVRTSFLVIFATLALSIVGTSFTNTAFAAEDKQMNMEIVESFMAKAYDEKDSAVAIAEYLSEDFMAIGQIDKEQMLENIAKIQEIFHDLARTSETTVADEDGDFVVVFSKWTSSGGNSETADLFKVIDGKIIEQHQSGIYSDQLIETVKANFPSETDGTTDNNNSTASE